MKKYKEVLWRRLSIEDVLTVRHMISHFAVIAEKWGVGLEKVFILVNGVEIQAMCLWQNHSM